MSNTVEKQKILDKYFPDMGVGCHKFSVETGICKQCNTFFADVTMRMCPVIGSDEVSFYRSNDDC